MSVYTQCSACPRGCGIDRTKQSAFCGEGSALRLASACLHFGEEPPVTARGGSGTIFVTGCNLRCAFCQNYQISQHGMGAAVTGTEFTEICLRLQELGAENINIVTGSHAAPVLAEYLRNAKQAGLSIPVCWNSSGYDSIRSLRLLQSVVDIWLPDFKTLDRNLARALFAAPDYPQVAQEAIQWMLRHFPLVIEGEKILRGVIVRHLFLPGQLESTVEALSWLKEHADGKACISLMSQYTPVPFAEEERLLAVRNTALSAIENRLVSAEEDTDLRDFICAFDFKHLFYQELNAGTDWLPDFERAQPFSNALARPVWHWQTGSL